ncbi:MAG TPA: DNA repair protein RecO [Candidatus Limnocylindria bacterium]|nr:DNA repair protein RecO [Candidatus Limnocylindria bacterium]
MSYRTTQAIVLSRAEWRENDRLLTLFSPEAGRLDAVCRGCRKPGNPLMAAAELFTWGEYVLFTGKGRTLVHSCQITENFYPLRLDYEKLQLASVFLQAALKVVQPEEPAQGLFILLARSLRRLAYTTLPPRAVAAAFLLHFAGVSGFAPRLDRCVRCGRDLAGEGGYLVAREGGVRCADCGAREPERLLLSAGALGWLREVAARGIDKAGELAGEVPYRLLAEYVGHHLDSELPEA